MGTGVKTFIKSISKEIFSHKWLAGPDVFSVYPYMHSPEQLIFIATTAKERCSLKGVLIEVGCARGATTAFVNKYIRDENFKNRYIAIDTFSGFPSDQVEYEIEQRSKPSAIRYAFTDNKIDWVRRSLELAHVGGVDLVEIDATKFDYGALGGVSWALLDVDLYLPIKAILPKLYGNLTSGGIIIVDDCMPDERWDGALQAYMEFVQENNLPVNILYEKLGIIERM